MTWLALIHAVTGCSYLCMSRLLPSYRTHLLMYPLRNVEWALSLPMLVRMLGFLCSAPADEWADAAMLQVR